MQLLVSVANAADAREALTGGADVIDAKDPAAGPLGAVAWGTLSETNATVAGSRALTAALGDAADAGAIEQAAHDAAAAGAAALRARGCEPEAMLVQLKQALAVGALPLSVAGLADELSEGLVRHAIAAYYEGR